MRAFGARSFTVPARPFSVKGLAQKLACRSVYTKWKEGKSCPAALVAFKTFLSLRLSKIHQRPPCHGRTVVSLAACSRQRGSLQKPVIILGFRPNTPVKHVLMRDLDAASAGRSSYALYALATVLRKEHLPWKVKEYFLRGDVSL